MSLSFSRIERVIGLLVQAAFSITIFSGLQGIYFHFLTPHLLSPVIELVFEFTSFLCYFQP